MGEGWGAHRDTQRVGCSQRYPKGGVLTEIPKEWGAYRDTQRVGCSQRYPKGGVLTEIPKEWGALSYAPISPCNEQTVLTI